MAKQQEYGKKVKIEIVDCGALDLSTGDVAPQADHDVLSSPFQYALSLVVATSSCTQLAIFGLVVQSG